MKRIELLKEILNNDDKEALNKFWNDIKTNHMPIIEKIEGDPEHVLVTFLYKGNKDVNNVVIMSGITLYSHEEGMMERLLDTDIWYKSFILKNDLRFDYELVINHPCSKDWDTIEKNSFLDPLGNKQLICPRDKDNSHSSNLIKTVVELPKAEPKRWSLPREGIAKGKLKLTRFYSDILDDNYKIWVYTPKDYDCDHINPYKTLVVNDGYEYIHALSAINVLDNLIHENQIPPMVAIFIESKQNRLKMLTCNNEFSSFIIEEVMPWARSNYNLSHKPKDHIIAGLSLGGLFATYLGINYSNIFGNVLSQSGAYQWYPEQCKKEDYKDIVWTAQEIEKREKLNIKFYLEVGTVEDTFEGSMVRVNKNVVNTLHNKGYTYKYSEF